MELRLTLVDPQRVGAQADVAVEASAGTTLADVAGPLAAALGRPEPGCRWVCGQHLLDGAQPLGLPPLLQGAVLTAASPGSAPPWAGRRPAGLLEAHVTAGPDAGTVIPLPLGRHAIGRGAGNLLQLTDPDASRRHAELTVSAAGVELQDGGSTNGTWVGGRRVGPDPVSLNPGQPVRIGSGQLTLRRPDRSPAAVTTDGEGHLRINRGPQLHPGRAEVEIHFPAEPPDRPPHRLPWLAMLLPILLAVPLAVLWKQPTFLVFALMTPLLMAGQHLADRRSGRRENAQRRARHAEVTAQRQQQLDHAVAVDAAHLEATRPDLARLSVAAGVPTADLWHRSAGHPGFLVLRVGRGSEASRVTVHRPVVDEPGGDGRAGEPSEHADAPLVVDLEQTPILGVCGPRETVLALARSLIGQLAVLHSPHELRIEIVTTGSEPAPDWRWLAWLPHCRRFDPEGVGSSMPADGFRRRVIIVDGAHRLRGRPEVATLLAGRTTDHPGRGPDRRPVVICFDRTQSDLPVECTATVTLDAVDRAVLRQAGCTATPFVPDLAGDRWTERLARHLAPLRDATPEPDSGLPDQVRLLDLLADADRVRPTDPDDLARHWRRRPNPEPAATVGTAVTGPFRIDLRRDGPHLLIGGTTGAGKSGLLQSLVAGLAVGSGPDAVSFLLVDYKGGAAFRECLDLPHVGGVITDLDPQLSRRALASLSAELRRRERLLSSVRTVDVDGYQVARSGRADLPAMPRLVVIVDEFRVLAEELPDFVSGLVRIATVGRSLGVHLVLATQRPAGIVSADLTANLNLRIALRVNDSSDSRDLIDDPAAAALPADRPGRALARCGNGPAIGFQTARVSGPASIHSENLVRVRRLDLDRLRSAGTSSDPDRPPPPSPGPAPSDLGPSDLALIVQAARAAAERLGLDPVHPPWLPALPEMIRREQLPAATTTGGLAFALIDRPGEQRQEALAWRLGGSHLAISGGPRSGRTTALTSIACAAASRARERDPELHLYAVDGAGSLSGLADLAGVEAVIAVHDSERAERLLRFLSAQIAARQAAPATEPHPGSNAGAPDPGPQIVLLIDGWEALTAAWGAVDHGRLIDQLIAVLRDGAAVGVQAAITGGRSLLTGAVSALLAERVVLRFADPADAVLAGVPPSRVPGPGDRGSAVAGRGLVLGPDFPEPAEIQVAWGGPAEVGSARGRVGTAVGPPVGQQSWRIPALPRRLEHRQLTTYGPGAWPVPRSGPGLAPGAVPIGVGGDEAQVLALDLDAGPATLVVGPAGSGRTSALRCIAGGLLQRGSPVTWVDLGPVDPSWAPAGMRIIDVSRPGAAVTLAGALAARPRATVLVDDAQRAAVPGAVPADLEDLLTAEVGRRRLVVAGSAPELLAAYRGLLAVVRTARSGLLLGAGGPGEAEVFGLRPERRPPAPPGRALLVRGGRTAVVQLALPPAASDQPAATDQPADFEDDLPGPDAGERVDA